MRRPTPLPPPAEPRQTSRDASADERGRVLPFVAAAAPWATAPSGADSGTLGDPEVGADAADVGLRDIWRASRAHRRALRAEVRRFTVRQRRRRMLWLGIAGALVLLVAGTVGAAYSPLFAVHRIEVVGATQLDAATVSAALDGQIGTPLSLVDESEVKAALVQFPLVESYSLEARPPNDLVVRIVERMPVGAIESPAGFTVLDAAGVALTTSAEPPAGLPMLDIEGGPRSDAFRAAGQVIRSLPDGIRAQVTAVAASTPDDVTLTLGGTNTQVVWGSAEESAHKALVLERTMIGRPPASVSLYDVSTPAAIVVR